MQRHILVPLDGSELGETVLPYALAYARATGCTICLIHVVAPPVYQQEAALTPAYLVGQC